MKSQDATNRRLDRLGRWDNIANSEIRIADLQEDVEIVDDVRALIMDT